MAMPHAESYQSLSELPEGQMRGAQQGHHAQQGSGLMHVESRDSGIASPFAEPRQQFANPEGQARYVNLSHV